MKVPATEANHCGCDLQKGGCDLVVGPTVGQVLAPGVSRRREVGLDATRRPDAFNDTYKDWISTQAALIDRIGVFGEDLRPW